MQKIIVPQEIHKAYSQILFEEEIELNMANQMLKILEGNKKDWEKIIIGENNSDLLNAKILYNMKGVL